MIACDYKCIITGAPFEDIHHIHGMNLIIAEALEEIDIPYDIDINTCDEETRQRILDAVLDKQSQYPLGVCLTKEIHVMFHRKYGYGNNTEEQFEEFLQSFPNLKTA